MAFRCPSCHRSAGLTIRQVFELPPDCSSDEITMQIVNCLNCDFRALAVYTESRRGRLDGDSWDHRGYYLEPDELQSIQAAISICPEPYNARCQCEAHHQWGAHDRGGEWQGFVFLGPRETFAMIMSDGYPQDN